MSLLDTVMEQGYSVEPTIPEAQVEAWREERIGDLMDGEPAWPGAHTHLSFEGARSLLEALEESLRQTEHQLRVTYGVPHHHNVQHPLAEWLLIILSRKTPEEAYLRAFRRLLGDVDSWEELDALGDEELLERVEKGGLGTKKVVAIREMLERVQSTLGSFSLEATRSWSDQEVKKLLMSVPEVGPKSALCVMMYAMERAAFPVDAHVGRVLMRLGMFELVGMDLWQMDHKQKQRYLEDLVPPDLRYALHVQGAEPGTGCMHGPPSPL